MSRNTKSFRNAFQVIPYHFILMFIQALFFTFYFKTMLGLIPLLFSISYQSKNCYIGFEPFRLPALLILSIVIGVYFENILTMGIVLGALKYNERQRLSEEYLLKLIPRNPTMDEKNGMNNIPTQKEPPGL